MNYPTSPRRETGSVSKLTVEYLKKFGRNRDLQQYFVLSAPLTTSTENLNTNTQQMETKIPASILIETKKGPLLSDLNLPSTSRIASCEYQRTPENNNIDTGRLSSASSVISDKRLEWDSGADVGYVNYYNSKHKEKSLSLPVLSTIESSADNSLSSSSRKSKKQTTFAESTPASNTHKFFQQNEAEITAISKEDATPLKATNNLQKDKSISLEDTRLKAESSPQKSLSQIDLPNIEKSSVIENMYIFSPMFLKSLNDKKEETSDKIIQTTLEKGPTKLSSKSTDTELYETARNNPGSFTKTSDDDQLLTKVNSMPKNIGFQIPTSSSFEYIPGNAFENEELMSSPGDYDDDELLSKIVDAKLNSNRSSNSSSISTNQDSSGHSIGSILMGSQYSRNLTKDLEHTVSAMRNIIEAKEYTESDKKRLIRKIVKKIVNTHYDDDPEDMKNLTCWTPNSSENVKSITTSINHSDNNISPGDVVSSPTVLTTFQISNGNTDTTRHSKIDSVSSPRLLTPFKLCQNTDIHDENEGEIPKVKDLVVGTEGKVNWKKDITFSEQLFAERIKNLQIQRRHLNKDQKKKRNIFTNVEQLHQKIVTESGGDTMSNKKLLKITEKERENQLKWIKSEIYYLNQLRLLLEDTNQIPITAEQVYALFSSQSLSSSSSSSSNGGSTTQSESIPRQAKQNDDIDKIIQKNYILTESSLSNQKSTKSHSKNINTKAKIDRDLQSKIISNIQDAQAKEFWKLNFNKTVKKRLKSNQTSSQISESPEPTTTRTSFPESDYNLIKDSFSQTQSSSRNTTENHYYEEKHKKQVLEIVDNESRTSYSEKNLKRLNPTVAIQTEIVRDTRQTNNLDQLSDYCGSNCGNKDKLICSKKHNKYYRNSSTQTSNKKINSSSSSEEYQPYNRRSKCYKSKQKVDQETQTDHKSSNSHTAQSIKNQFNLINSNTSSLASINQQNCNTKQQYCTCNQNWLPLKNTTNSTKSNNQSNETQQTSPSLYLNLKNTTDITDTTSTSQRNSSSADVSPETVHDSGTNSIEFIKIAQKVAVNNHKSKYSPKHVNYKTWPMYLELYHDVFNEFVPNSDRVHQHANKHNIQSSSEIQSKGYLSPSDHDNGKRDGFEKTKKYYKEAEEESLDVRNAPVHQHPNKNNIRSSSKIQSKGYLSPSDRDNDKRDGFEKTKKCYKEAEEESLDVRNAPVHQHPNKNNIRSSSKIQSKGYLSPSDDDNDKRDGFEKTKKCYKEAEEESLDVRNAPSCYYTSNNNYNTQLSESISRRFPNSKGLSDNLSKESSHVFEDYASLSESSHHHHQYSRSISKRTSSSSEVITIDPPHMNMVTRHEHEDKVHATSSSVECFCIHHQLNLHKRIQQMLNRCDICSKQRSDNNGGGGMQQTSSAQIKYCNECFCQCLDSNSNNNKQQITTNDNDNDVLCCKTCKLLQQQQEETNSRHHHNSIAYFLRIESRDDLIILDENQQQTKSTTTNTRTIEEVKIYVPKFRPPRDGGGYIIRNNHTKYVAEIGLDNNQKSYQSLQECLSKNKPEFINAADNRQQCLKEISKKRSHNTNSNNVIEINYNNINNNKNNNNRITPKKNQFFSSKNMKEITYRKYRTLAEVEQKKYNMKLFRQRRRNRLMMQLFNKKLQQKVHKGELDFSLTKTLL